MKNPNKLLELNKDQLEAVNSTSGNLLIIASAGTGKTTTIVERYANLINNHNVKPSEILMTTFTNKAAKDMVSKIFKKTKTSPPYIGTMHSIFLKVLRDNSEKIGIPHNFSIIDEYDKKKMIKNILLSESIPIKSDNLRYFIRWIGKFKNRGILSKNLSEDFSIDDNKSNGIIQEAMDDDVIYISPLLRKKVNKVYKKYDAELRKLNQIDLDDILLLVLTLFKTNDELREKYKKKFKAIMVDEAQDLNFVQIDILGLIQNNNLCVIGDDCQNIYEWRGSSPELVFNFNNNQKKVTLKENHRSARRIISCVNDVINSMKFKIDKQLVCTKGHDGEIQVLEFHSSKEEIDYLVSQLKMLQNGGIPREDIAVLFRTNNIGKEVERELKKNHIPCHLSKSVSFFEREEIKDIVSFLRLKLNPLSILDFQRVMSLLTGFGKGTIKKFEDISIKFHCSLVDSLNYYSEIKLSPDKLFELSKLIKVLSNFQKSSVSLFLDDFGYTLKLTDRYSQEFDRLDDKLENIETFKELFSEYGNSMGDIREFLDSLIEIDRKEKTSDRITLSTIHSAKGLEWKYVFLISCNETILPLYFSQDLDSSKEESELRLFYVALSRAKDSLIITHYLKNSWGKYFDKSRFIDIVHKHKSPSKSLSKFNSHSSFSEFVSADTI